jgi:hypothetical protein
VPKNDLSRPGPHDPGTPDKVAVKRIGRSSVENPFHVVRGITLAGVVAAATMVGLQARDRIAEWKSESHVTNFADAVLDVGIDLAPGFITQMKRCLPTSFDLRVALRKRAKQVDRIQNEVKKLQEQEKEEAVGQALSAICSGDM